MGYTIKAPQGDYQGTSCGVVFTDGTGYLSDDNPGALAYFKSAGYTVAKGGKARDHGHLSTHPDGGPGGRAPASRDAAVLGKDAEGPNSNAFLVPTNAGKGLDPHGPEVVAPGLHGSAPGPILPGPVAPRGDEDPADPEHTEAVEDEQAQATERQEQRETEAAERVLVGEEPNDAGLVMLPPGTKVPRKSEDVLALAEQLQVDTSGSVEDVRGRLKARIEG